MSTEADLVSPDTQVTMAKKYLDVKHLFAVEVTRLTIHVVQYSGTPRELTDFMSKVLLKRDFNPQNSSNAGTQQTRSRAGP